MPRCTDEVTINALHSWDHLSYTGGNKGGPQSRVPRAKWEAQPRVRRRGFGTAASDTLHPSTAWLGPVLQEPHPRHHVNRHYDILLLCKQWDNYPQRHSSRHIKQWKIIHSSDKSDLFDTQGPGLWPFTCRKKEKMMFRVDKLAWDRIRLGENWLCLEKSTGSL